LEELNKTVVLRGINLTVEEGEFISIRGKSGAGKTTLLRIMGLLETPDKGEVRLFGRTVNQLKDHERSSLRLHYVGFVFQFFNLIPSLTVLENIELPLALAKVNKKERRKKAYELLEYFGLSELANRFPETLSGGEKQRVAVIRAIINNPRVILADDENSVLLIELLRRINVEKETTVVLATTDLYEKLPTTRDYILRSGRLYEMKPAT